MKLLSRKWTSYLWVLLPLSIAFFLRSPMFLHGDFYYLIDQARDLMLVKDIVIDGNITLIGARSGLGGIFHGPLWLYMLVPTFLLSGGDPFWTLIPVFLSVGLGIVAAGFFIGLKLYGKLFAVIFSLFLAIAPSLIDSTVSMTNAQVMPLIFLAYLYSTILYLRGREKFLIGSILLIGVGFQFESAFSVFLVPLTVAAVLLRRKIPPIKDVAFGVVGALFAVSSFILFELRNKFLMSGTALKLFSGGVEQQSGYEQYADLGFRIQDRIQLFASSFFSPLFQTNTLSNVSVLLVYIIVIGWLFFQFVIKKQQDEKIKELIFLLLIPVLYFSLFILYPHPLWPHYLLPITISSSLLLTVGIFRLIQLRSLKPFVIFLSVVILLPAIQYASTTYSTPYQPSSEGSYLNQLQVADSVYQDAGAESFGYFTYHPAILTYSMDYLFWWLDSAKYHTSPTNIKQASTYLILYKAEATDKNAHQFWKTKVVRTTGTVTDDWSFSSGIRVEKLSIIEHEPEPDPNYYINLTFR